MSEAATMVGAVNTGAPASGATMLPGRDERVVFIPKMTLIAGALAVTMMSPPVLAPVTLSISEGGETANCDLAFADESMFDRVEVDLETLHPELELRPLPTGFRLAALESPPPFVDPDLLALVD